MKSRASLPILLLFAVAVLAYFGQAQLAATNGQWAAPLDDAWIHFQYARNLARGAGFSYNPGVPTPGSTAPLWTVLLAAPALFTENLMPWGLLFSAAFWLLALLLTYGMLRNWEIDNRYALLAALGVAFVGRMGWAAWSAMEATAFAALSLAAIWAYTRYGMRIWVAALFGLATQLRPEGHALFGLAGLLFCYESWRREDSFGRILKTGTLAVITYTLISLPYVLFSLSTTGKPLPNTFYAKSTAGTQFSLRTLRETALLHWQDNPMALLLLPFGLTTLWRHSKLSLLWLLGLPLFTALIVDNVWHHGRYTLPLIPLQIVAAVCGVVAIGSWFGRKTNLQPYATGLLALVLLASGLIGLPRWATMLATNSREILDIDVALGEWVRDNTPADALIAVDDIGAIAYISERTVFDLNGLVSPEMWPVVAIPRGLPRNQAETRLLAEVQPDYLVVFPKWHYELTLSAEIAPLLHEVTTETRTMILDTRAGVYDFNSPYLSKTAPLTGVDAIFGDAIQLAGFDGELASGDITLSWQSLALVDVDYDLFVHVTAADGTIVAQDDGPPVSQLAPTSLWQAGDFARYRRTIFLPDDLASGQYTVTAGLYRRDTFERLPTTGRDATGDSVLLGTFER